MTRDVPNMNNVCSVGRKIDDSISAGFVPAVLKMSHCC